MLDKIIETSIIIVAVTGSILTVPIIVGVVIYLVSLFIGWLERFK